MIRVQFAFTAILLGCLVTGLQCQTEELFRNPGMEDEGIFDMYRAPNGYIMERVSDSYSGEYAMKVQHRTATWMGVGQYVDLKENSMYRLSAWVKLLNDNTKIWQTVSFVGAYKFKKNNKTEKIEHARYSFGAAEKGWIHVTGDFNTPSTGWCRPFLSVQGPDAGIDFLVDDISLQEVPQNPNWISDAEDSIEKTRKGDFSLSISIGDNFNPSNIDVEVTLRKHAFGFGCRVNDEFILNPDFEHYQLLFYDFFNWATVQFSEWELELGKLKDVDYSRATRALEELKNHGVKVRGKNMFWGGNATVPRWVRGLPVDELELDIQTRAEYLTYVAQGKLEHWDVSSGLLHDHLFAELSRDKTFSQYMFASVIGRDTDTALYLNDYNVVANGASTDEFIRQAEELKAADVGLSGLGLQGNFYYNTAPDPVLIKDRLDRLASTGLPLLITELSVTTKNETARAEWLEVALTTMFAHPAVEGVILWAFWQHDGTLKHQELVNGNAYYINEAGQRYQHLVKSKWNTNIVTGVTGKHTTLDLNGYYGEYDVIIRYEGRPIKLQNFTVSKDVTETVQVTVDGSGDEIDIPSPTNFTMSREHMHHLSTGTKHLLRTVRAPANSGEPLMCGSVVSGYEVSGLGDMANMTANVTCDDVYPWSDGVILTSCYGSTWDRTGVRNGEYFTFEGDTPVCRSETAWNSNSAVSAQGFCCVFPGMECTYVKAGPSGHGVEDQIEAVCPRGNYALGCTAYSKYGVSDGAYNSESLRSCIAQNDGMNPVYVTAACCHHPHMSCYMRKSSQRYYNTQPDKKFTASISECDAGDIVVSCAAYSEDGGIGNVEPWIDHGCMAFTGRDRYPGEDRVLAVTVCCHFDEDYASQHT